MPRPTGVDARPIWLRVPIDPMGIRGSEWGERARLAARPWESAAIPSAQNLMLQMGAASATLRAMAKGQAFLRLATWGLVLGLASGCDPKDQATLPKVSFTDFEKDAYPVLLRDCAFPACHGNSERLFQVYGSGRARLPDPAAGGEVPGLSVDTTPVELQVSFARARSMLLYRDDLEQAPLLRKPVQGGAHFGTDLWGRNVFASKKASGYVILKKWAQGAKVSSKADDNKFRSTQGGTR